MTPQELVASLKRKIVDDQMAHCRRSLAEAHKIENDRYTQWPRVSRLYQQLGDEDQRALEWALRQVMVDTLSSVFGVLDGVSPLDRYRGAFHLFYEDGAEQLNGDLLDYFLAGET